MNNSTIIINNYNNADRVTEIIISNNKYIIFTLSHHSLIVIDISNKENPILLFNRSYNSYNDLLNKFDEIVNSVLINSNDFIYSMDTYIDLLSGFQNETTNEIISVYKIILEEYNL